MEQNRKYAFVIAIYMAVGIILFTYTGCSSDKQVKENISNNSLLINQPTLELKSNMRKLWEDHVMWTRNVIFCLIDNLPGTEQAVKRLLQNQVDIGNAFKLYYGKDAGDKLTDLLYPHIIISAEVIVAAKNGNKAALELANKAWHANADEISVYFNEINPNWKLEDMKMMMKIHLDLATDEVTQRIKKDYDADVLAFDKAHKEILMMADMLSDGIIKQFPEKFETGCISLK